MYAKMCNLILAADFFFCISEVIQGQKSISGEQNTIMWLKKKLGASVLFWLDKLFLVVLQTNHNILTS